MKLPKGSGKDNSINEAAIPARVKKGSFFTTTLPLFMIAHFGHHLMTALPAVLLPFIRDDRVLTPSGMSNSQVAWVTTAFSLAHGLGQLPGGWLADRIGRRLMIGIGIFGVALVGILVGLSSTYMMLLLLLVVMGIVGGGYHPAATPWISASAGEKNQGRAIGFHFVGGGSGFFVAPFIGAAIAAAWGWHMSFVVLAAPCAAFGLVFFFLLNRRKEASGSQAAFNPHQATAGAAQDRWTPLITLIVLSLITSSLSSVMIFFSLYLVDEYNVAKQTAVFVMAISAFAGIWAGPLGGWISDRIGRVQIMVGSSIIAGLIIFCVRYLGYGPSLFALLFVSGINMNIFAPVSEAFIMTNTSARHRSLIYGIYYLSSNGGALFAPLMGFLIDQTSYQTAFMVSGAASIGTAVVCGAILLRSRK